MKNLSSTIACMVIALLALASPARAQDKTNTAVQSEHSGPNGGVVMPPGTLPSNTNTAVQSEHSGPNGGVVMPPGTLPSNTKRPAPDGPNGGFVPPNNLALEVNSESPGHDAGSVFNIDLTTGKYTIISASNGAVIAQKLDSMGTLSKRQLKELETALDAVKAAHVQGRIPGTTTANGAQNFTISWAQGLDQFGTISGPIDFKAPSGMGPSHGDVLTAWDSVVPLLDRMKSLEAKAIKDHPYKPELDTVETKDAKGAKGLPALGPIDTVTTDRGNTAPVIGNAGETGPAKPGFSTADPASGVSDAIRSRGTTGPRTGLGQALTDRMDDAAKSDHAGEK